MANKFDLKKYLTENKMFSQSNQSPLKEARPTGFGTGTGRSKTVAKGGEGDPEVIAKLKAKEKEEEEKLAKSKEARKFKMIDGVPHKLKDGKYVPLKKKMQEMDDDDTGASVEDLYQMDQEMLDKIKRDKEDKKYPTLDDVVDPDDPFDLELDAMMDMMEAKKKDEEEEVEDIDIEDDAEMDVEEPADGESMMGDEISDEQQDLQKQLTQAYNSALKMGDEKLTTQLSNTITYYLKTLF